MLYIRKKKTPDAIKKIADEIKKTPGRIAVQPIRKKRDVKNKETWKKHPEIPLPMVY